MPSGKGRPAGVGKQNRGRPRPHSRSSGPTAPSSDVVRRGWPQLEPLPPAVHAARGTDAEGLSGLSSAHPTEGAFEKREVCRRRSVRSGLWVNPRPVREGLTTVGNVACALQTRRWIHEPPSKGTSTLRRNAYHDSSTPKGGRRNRSQQTPAQDDGRRTEVDEQPADVDERGHEGRARSGRVEPEAP
jgi:hypothetical protein